MTVLKANSFTCLLDSTLVGTRAARSVPAVQVGKTRFFARNVTARDYQTAIAAEGTKGDSGSVVAEFMTGKPTSPFGGPV